MRLEPESWRSRFLWVNVAVYLAVLLRNWSSLPPRLATHFAVSGSVNGTQSRETFALATLLLLVGLTLVFSLALRAPASNALGSRVAHFALCYGALGFATAVNIRLMVYNLHGGAIASVAAAAALACAAVGCAIALTTVRPADASRPPLRKARAGDSAIIGQEVHKSTLQTALLGTMAACIAMAWIALLFSPAAAGRLLPARIIFGFVGCVIGYFAILTALGFRYRVSPKDIEIDWGFRRMEVIPAAIIDSISVEPIHPVRDFGGYGQRSSGPDRAYILKGKTAVKIKTAFGDVYLGSSTPEHLLALLRRMDVSRG